MTIFYVTQERAFAPGIAGEWPNIIPKPDNPNGRLVRVNGVNSMLRGIEMMIENRSHSPEWLEGFRLAKKGYYETK